jgi:uncharacterized membrane protein
LKIDQFATRAGHGFEVIGVAVLVGGAALAIAAFLLRLSRGGSFPDAYHELRADLGRAILLGLEFLVIADIIGTVAVEPTLQNLAVLAVIVAPAHYSASPSNWRSPGAGRGRRIGHSPWIP